MRIVNDQVIGVPCLQVDDVPIAAGYYRDVLGFEQVAMLGGLPPTLAIMRVMGAVMLLQTASMDEPPKQDRPPGPPWDAVLLVPDVSAAHEVLTGRGASGIGPVETLEIGWRNFEFTDGSGNRICVGDSAVEFFEHIAAPAVVPMARQRAKLRGARARRQERPELRAFRTFQESGAAPPNAFYMFFTSGLLHWVARACRFVPRDVELVLVGSALTAGECEWIATHLDRPFHHIALAVDDVTVWEFLFATVGGNFGWLDIDCFVLDPGVFRDLLAIEPHDSMTCAWSWDSGYGFPVANTHLVFVNRESIRAVEALGVTPSPCTYDWYGSSRRYPPRDCYMHVPSSRERELLLRLLPPDAVGRPQLLFGDYYDTTVLFQLLARVGGHRVRPVRSLVRRCRVPPDASSSDPEDWPEDISDEAFHLYGVSYYALDDHDSHVRTLFLAAELAVLDGVGEPLPALYDDRRAKLAAELAALDVDPSTAREVFHRHLVDVRGLSEDAAATILDPSPSL